jgi:hypothetical protein
MRPGKTLPIDLSAPAATPFAEIGNSSYEGMTLEALETVCKQRQEGTLKIELDYSLSLWDWGDVLLEIKARLKGKFTKWKKENFSPPEQRRADKALRIRQQNEKRENVHKNIEEAMAYGNDEFTVEPNESYVLNDGRIVRYAFHSGKSFQSYIFDGTTVTQGDLTGDDVRCVSDKKIDKPTEAQLETVFPRSKPKGKNEPKGKSKKSAKAQPAPTLEKAWVIRGGVQRGNITEAIPKAGEKTYATEAEARAAIAKKLGCNPEQLYTPISDGSINFHKKPQPELCTWQVAFNEAADELAKTFEQWGGELEGYLENLERLRLGVAGPDAYKANPQPKVNFPEAVDTVLKALVAECKQLSQPKLSIKVVGNAPRKQKAG